MKGSLRRRAGRARAGAFWLAAIGIAAGTGLGLWFLGTRGAPPRADAGDPAQVALGREVYARACARCHGANLEGQANWQERLPDGRLPAPPHDEMGHTWHHPDRVLFEITKYGIAPFAPPGYRSDMGGFGESLSDEEIWAVLAFIKSRWPADIRARQAEISAQAER